MRALAESREVSEEKLLSRDAKGDSIRGIIKEVYCLPNGDQWQIRNGSQAMFSNEKQLRKTLGVDRSEAIANAESQVQELQRELTELDNDESRLEIQHTDIRREWTKAQKENQNNETLINDLGMKIEELRNEIETSANIELDTTEYEEDVAQQEEEVNNLGDQETELRAEIEDLMPEIEDLRKRIQESFERNKKVLEDIERVQEEMTQHIMTQNQTQEMIEKKRKKMEQYRAAAQKHREKVEDIESKKEEALRTARLLHYQYLAQRKMREEQGVENTPLSPPEPTDEELEAIEPATVNKTLDHYEAKINLAEKKLEKERARRLVLTEDKSVAYEKYIRAKENLGKYAEVLLFESCFIA